MRSKALILLCLCMYGFAGMASSGYASIVPHALAGTLASFPCAGHHCACATRSRCLAHCCCFPKKTAKAPLTQTAWKACGGMVEGDALAQLRVPECPTVLFVWSVTVETAPLPFSPSAPPDGRPSEIPTPPPRPLA